MTKPIHKKWGTCSSTGEPVLEQVEYSQSDLRKVFNEFLEEINPAHWQYYLKLKEKEVKVELTLFASEGEALKYEIQFRDLLKPMFPSKKLSVKFKSKRA